MNLHHIAIGIFVFCFGACVGSFLNVVIYRLPAGMSVSTPPSRCPTCGALLRFGRENLPILGWFMVRGKCRYCGVKVSAEYMIIELLMALTFLGFYIVLFAMTPQTPWWGQIGGAWWYFNGLPMVWPVFTAWMFLVAGLVAMTIIDARTFTIPIQIPLFVTIAAFIAYPLQALMPMRTTASQTWPIQAVCWPGFWISLGGMIGVVLSCALLKMGVLRYSFSDYHEYVKEGETLGDYPHGRREMKVEILFLLPCLLGMVIGWFVGQAMPATPPPLILQALGGSFAGYLVGGGMIWAIRILGTLGFGREAMGMGDVHLLGAIGAVLGWFDPILIFFIAPFLGLLWAVLSIGMSTIFKRAGRALPYGPHLAVATLVVILARPGVHSAWRTLMPNVPWPAAGLCTTSPGATPAPSPSRPARNYKPSSRPASSPATQP